MAEYSGSGDPTRSLELLWGVAPVPSRGPRPGLSVAQIVTAAVELADAEGLAALSMRRVADRLGVGAMTLYRYVPGKAELLDVMLDTVAAELTPATGAGWRDRLRAVARADWELYHRHPWILQVSTSRPVLGPHMIARYDRALATVDGVGLSDLEMDAVVTLVTGYVQGVARTAVEAAQALTRTGVTDEQWWTAHAPVLSRMFDPERYPLATRVGAAAGEAYQGANPPDQGFEFGLDRVLDGVGLLIAGSVTPRA